MGAVRKRRQSENGSHPKTGAIRKREPSENGGHPKTGAFQDAKRSTRHENLTFDRGQELRGVLGEVYSRRYIRGGIFGV
jgi:hypothetical protein